MNWIITFPQQDKERKDGWVRIINAKDLAQVKNFADHQYKGGYASIYQEDMFQEGYFPNGCLEEFDFRAWHDYVI